MGRMCEVEIGENRTAILYYDDNNKLVKLTESHLDDNGNECGGTIFLTYDPVGYEGDEWEVRQDKPWNVTIYPSINCHRCKSHGWIENGRWYRHVSYKRETLLPNPVREFIDKIRFRLVTRKT